MAITYDPTTAEPGIVTKVDPTTIVIDLNVREDIRLDKSFVSSIRVRGFEQLPTGYVEDGQTHITIGQRRISAALEIGWPVIPVIIKPKHVAEEDRAEEHRILTQLAENEQRAPLSDTEVATGYKQLSLIGVTEEMIARKTNSPRTRVTTALKVADSQTALAAIDKHNITLDQAAVLVEFENDDKATKALTEQLERDPFRIEHAAQQQRHRIARELDAKRIEDEAIAAGWAVHYLGEYEYGIPNGMQRITSLWVDGDKKRTPLTVDDVANLKGRVVVINAKHGETADATWCLKDHKKHGFASYSDSSGSTSSGPLSEEEKAARRQKRIDKSEMTAATVVRRIWIKDTLLASKPALDVTIPWIADAVIGSHRALGYDQASQSTARDLACELLGIENDRDGRDTLEKAIAATNTTPERVRIVLAYAIALVEHQAGNQRHHSYAQNVALAPYFLQLEAWGYPLADVEQRIVTAAAKGGRK